MPRLIYHVLFLLSTYKFQFLEGSCNIASETIASGTCYGSCGKLCSGDLIFEDNFDSFNLAKWQHEITLAGGGNWEFQYYTNNRSNSYVDNGFLHIAPTLLTDDYGEDFLYSGTLDVNGGAPADVCTNAAYYGCSRTGTSTNIVNPIKSARIRTVESFSFRYGTVVVRAKMPSGDWLWPAIWLLPRYNSYGHWPASGEIDILESRGNRHLFNEAGENVGTHQASSTLHWGPFTSANQWPKTRFEKTNVTGYNTDFHIYKLVWTSSGFAFYIDDVQIGSFSPPEGGFWEAGQFSDKLSNPWKSGSKMAPFDQQFYLIINLAVGGINYFNDNYNNTPAGKPWSNTSPTSLTDFWQGRNQWEPTWNLGTDDPHLIIDYVHVFAI